MRISFDVHGTAKRACDATAWRNARSFFGDDAAISVVDSHAEPMVESTDGTIVSWKATYTFRTVDAPQ